MANIDVNNGQQIEVITQDVMEMLDRMMTEHLVEAKTVKKAIRSVESKVRKTVQTALKASVDKNKGKLYTRTRSGTVHYRHVEASVKMMIYKSILGANVSLYSKKHAGSNSYQKPIQGRYNPRRYRSKRTKKMESYSSGDLWMIAQWINSGTGERRTGGRFSYYQGQRRGWSRNFEYDSKHRVRNYHSSHSTGHIPGTNFFSVAPSAQGRAAEELAVRLDKILTDINNSI